MVSSLDPLPYLDYNYRVRFAIFLSYIYEKL